MVTCGYCKQQHSSIDDVRMCAARHVEQRRSEDQLRQQQQRELLLAKQIADRAAMDAVKEKKRLEPVLRRFRKIYREMMPLELTEDQQEQFLAASPEGRNALYRQWRAERVNALAAQKEQLEGERRQLESDESQHQERVDGLTSAEKTAYYERLRPREYWPNKPFDDWREQA
jgi:hypothetical protein